MTRHRVTHLLAGLVLSSSTTSTVLAATPDESFSQVEAVYLLLWLLFGVIYFAPTVLAFVRQHPNRWAIFVFGATAIGWLGALIWAAHAVHKSSDGYTGGESGLNVFGNDQRPVQHIRVEPLLHPPGSKPLDATDELVRLRRLYEGGTLSDAEYRKMRDQRLRRI